MPLFQHGLKLRGLPFASEGHAGFFVVTPFSQFLDDSLADHLFLEAAQPFLHRLRAFLFCFDSLGSRFLWVCSKENRVRPPPRYPPPPSPPRRSRPPPPPPPPPPP